MAPSTREAQQLLFLGHRLREPTERRDLQAAVYAQAAYRKRIALPVIYQVPGHPSTGSVYDSANGEPIRTPDLVARTV